MRPTSGERAGRRPDLTCVAAWGFSALAAGFFVLMTGVIAWQSRPAWAHAGLGLLTGRRWFFRAHEFGALPMLYGTLAVAGVALLLAGPLGLGGAVFTAEILGSRARVAVKSAVELLASIPSVVYGLVGVLVLRGWMEHLLAPFDPLSGDTLATAGVLLAVMVLPTVLSLADDALAAVPERQRQAARSLGLNRAQTIFAVSLPQALPGLGAALLLALGRALGETIAVFLVVGRQDNQWPEKLLSLAPLTSAGQTLTSKLGGSEVAIAYGDPLHWGALMALGVVLLLTAAGISWLGAHWVARGTLARRSP